MAKPRGFYYETHTSNQSLELKVKNDKEAIASLKETYGENLRGVFIIFHEDGENNMRTVWSEHDK